jgi:flagellar hook-associated protein 3 FlgL
MQISTSQFYGSSLRRMTDLSAELAKYSAQASGGPKLTVASQDTVAWGRLTQNKRASTDEKQYGANLDMAAGLLQQSDDALEGIGTQLQRVRELAVRAASETLTDDDRASIATELDGIVDAMMDIANVADARGVPLFAGADGATPFAKDETGRVTYRGKGEPPAIPVSASGSVAATDSGARVFGAIGSGEGRQDMFAIVQNLAGALRNGSTAMPEDRAAMRGEVDAALTATAAADERITNVRASIGARGARVALQQDQLTALAETREIERSGLEDADTTEALVKLQQFSTALSATQASFSKLAGLSLFDYLS